MTTFTITTKALVVTAAVALLAACGGGSDGDKAKTGTLKLGITDAPVDEAYQVHIQFSGVELKPKGGQAFSIDFATPKNIELLALQGERRAMLLDGEVVPAGEYEWMRLKVNADPDIATDSHIVLTNGGMACEMRIPSGDQTGLKLIRGFTVGVGTITDFTIDFDLRKSIVAPPGQNMPGGNCSGQVYMLKPVLRMVDNLQVGTIAGTVASTTVQGQCASATAAPYPGNVYLFGPIQETTPGVVPNITPDDYDGIANDQNGADAIASAKVDPNTFGYTIGFVPAGHYEVVYTCDLDNITLDADVTPNPPEVVDLIPPDGTPVTVTAKQTSTVNF